MEATTIVYFAEREGLIKIGCSASLPHRMRKLGTRLLSAFEGTFADERAMHERFAHLRGEGEWFSPGAELVQFISDLPTYEPTIDPLRPGQVAELFKVCLQTVANWADDGKLPHFKTPGGQRRFNRADVDEFIAKQGSAA